MSVEKREMIDAGSYIRCVMISEIAELWECKKAERRKAKDQISGTKYEQVCTYAGM